LKRGDILVFSTLLVHATSEPGGERVRMAASFRFNDAADASYIERGLPIPYSYKADMAVCRGCAAHPKQILRAHLPDQRAQVRFDLRAPSPPPRFPPPVAAKAGPMPTHERFRLDNRDNRQD
jgi:hypothetical protein